MYPACDETGNMIYYICTHLEEIVRKSSRMKTDHLCLYACLLAPLIRLQNSFINDVLIETRHTARYYATSSYRSIALYMTRKGLTMDRHNTEVEIVHNAYHQLWQHMHLSNLLRKFLHFVEQFAPIQAEKIPNRFITHI